MLNIASGSRATIELPSKRVTPGTRTTAKASLSLRCPDSLFGLGSSSLIPLTPRTHLYDGEAAWNSSARVASASGGVTGENDDAGREPLGGASCRGRGSPPHGRAACRVRPSWPA